jgi:pyruvate dehydrogenase E2 component (dihydrolipoamide acetyltransferase)
VLASIVTPAGTLVPVREVMAVIALPGEAADAAGASVADPYGAPAAPSPPASPGSASASATPPAPAAQVVPAARRLAREHGIDLSGVTGSGPAGRITEADVRAHLEGLSAVPLTGTRGLIARRMVASLHNSAQFTLTRSADVTELARLHDRGGLPPGVTYTDVLGYAAVKSLAEHPA